MKKTLLIIFLVICFWITVNAQTKIQNNTLEIAKNNQIINWNLIVKWTINSFWLKSFWSGTIVNWMRATAMWYNSQANWIGSFAVWVNSIANWNGSLAMWDSVTTNWLSSTAIWEDVVTSWDWSIWMWIGIEVNWKNSIAMWKFITVYSNHTTAIWKGIIASGENSTIIGKYNKIDQNKIFIVWNGDNWWNRSNALSLDYDWNLYIQWNLFQNSNEQSKENVEKLDNSLSKILNLNWYYYNLKNDNSKSKKIWLSSREIEKSFPELIIKDSNWNYSIDYNALLPVLIESLKELNEKVDEMCR